MMEDYEYISDRLNESKLNSNMICALYGTGEGADIIYNALKDMNMSHIIEFVIERDESSMQGKYYHGIQIQKIDDVYNKFDCILVAAKKNYKVIQERIEKYYNLKNYNIKIVNVFGSNSLKEKGEYIEYIEKAILKEADEFVQFEKNGFVREKEDVKLIAWYLPQYHQISINNEFHGQGFTEWTNTTRAFPMFLGHYQPHIPFDVGYYDLNNLETYKRQIFLARQYGIYGFCFHYYWFSGKRIMEKPIEIFLNHKELDMPFCLSWATENWTSLWDGGKKDIICEQKLLDGDEEKFYSDILSYMKDERYIYIDGKPVLIIYRCDMFKKERFLSFLQSLRDKIKTEGFPDLYIMLSTAGHFQEDVKDWGADALVEFPPWLIGKQLEDRRPKGYLNPYFKGIILDTIPFIKDKKYLMSHKSEHVYRSVLTSFDNTARKSVSGAQIYLGLNPSTYKVWLKDVIQENKETHNESENIVFINSWNEWAEGSHLEPDMKYGYAYLQATKEAIEEMREK